MSSEEENQSPASPDEDKKSDEENPETEKSANTWADQSEDKEEETEPKKDGHEEESVEKSAEESAEDLKKKKRDASEELTMRLRKLALERQKVGDLDVFVDVQSIRVDKQVFCQAEKGRKSTNFAVYMYGKQLYLVFCRKIPSRMSHLLSFCLHVAQFSRKTNTNVLE